MADKPVTREEKYLAYLTGDYTGELPKPITRKEKYLYELCLKGIGGEISPEEIKNAVNEYLEKNPVKPGATTEQAQQIEQNKTDVASLQTETSSLKEDISNKITKFYASNQGETHITDSDNGKIQDMMLYGRSEQKQYKGINLLPTGISYGEIIEVSIPKGTRIFWATDGTPAIGGNFKFYNEDKTQEKWFGIDAGKITMTETMDIDAKYMEFLIGESELVKICLGIGDDPVYEPYTGGQPSPSPNYPQEIKSVVNPTVKIVGKNLLSYASCELGNISEIDGTLGVNNNYIRSQFVKVCPGKVITLSAADGYVTHKIVEYDANNAMVKNNESGTANVITITLNKNTVKVRTVVRLKEAGVIPDEKDIQIQLEYGITRTAYKPYHEQTVTLPYTLNAIPVTSGGNVTIDGQQYIADYVDVENGKYVRKIGIIQLENINIGTVENSEDTYILNKGGTGILTGKASTEINNITCTHFGNNGETWVSKVNCISWSGGTPQQIRVKTDKSAEELLTLLNNGNVYIDYVLAEPVETDLTPEEIQAFKELTTYYPVTNISVNSDQLDGYTVFNYPVSMANGWNYVKQQLSDNRDYIYNMDAKTQDIDTQSTEAYVNSEYAVALTELEVM